MTQLLTTTIFFGIVYFLSIKERAVTDILSKYIMPITLLVIVLIFIKALNTPFHTSLEQVQHNDIFQYGFITGYQTLNAISAVLFRIVIIQNLKSKGIIDIKTQQKTLIQAGIIACLGLSAIYLGLIYQGSQISGMAYDRVSGVILHIVQKTYGTYGNIIFGICASTACLTTAIAMVALAADWFSKITKISYSHLVLGIIRFSALLTLSRMDQNIIISQSILSFLYSVIIALIGPNLLNASAKYFKWVTYLTLIISFFISIRELLQ